MTVLLCKSIETPQYRTDENTYHYRFESIINSLGLALVNKFKMRFNTFVLKRMRPLSLFTRRYRT
jgi:hypothetical protein